MTDISNFTAQATNNTSVELSELKGRQVVIYFYPKDNTPGCTNQACNLRDNHQALQEAGYTVIGVSADSVESHKKFEKKYDLPFPLIADTDKKIIRDYGVWGPKQFMGRKYDGIHRRTFLIDEEGKIEKIIEKVKTKDHTSQILAS